MSSPHKLFILVIDKFIPLRAYLEYLMRDNKRKVLYTSLQLS
jgi:hypothetical protein